jgi:hypothetical protein
MTPELGQGPHSYDITRRKHFKLLAKCGGVAREYYVAVSCKYEGARDCFFIKIEKGENYTRKSFPSDMIDPFNT